MVEHLQKGSFGTVGSGISDLHLTEVSPFKSIRLAWVALTNQQNKPAGGGKEQAKPRDRLKSGGWEGIIGKMKRCCQGELGVQGTPPVSGICQRQWMLLDLCFC